MQWYTHACFYLHAHVNKRSRDSKMEANTSLYRFRNLQIYVILHVVLIILMCNYGHVLHAAGVHEPLG